MADLPGSAGSYGAGDAKGSAGRVIEQRVQTAAEAHHLVRAAGEPRLDPLRPLEEREGRGIDPPDRAAAHEPAGVDEADVIQDATRRREADGHGTVPLDRG